MERWLANDHSIAEGKGANSGSRVQFPDWVCMQYEKTSDHRKSGDGTIIQ